MFAVYYPRLLLWCGLCCLASLTMSAQAQDLSALQLADSVYVSLSEFATQMGFDLSHSSNSLTVRSPQGVLVVFDRAPDVLWRPAGTSQLRSDEGELGLSAPVVLRDGNWYAPTDLYSLWNTELQGGQLVHSSRRFALRFPEPSPHQQVSGGNWEALELANSVYGLALYSMGSAGPESLSLLLVDIGLLPIAQPQQRQHFSDFLGQVRQGRPLYFVVNALAESSWNNSISFSQGGQQVTLHVGNGLSLLEGSADYVSPNQAAAGIALLPDDFSLSQAIQVRWAGVSATFQFRR